MTVEHKKESRFLLILAAVFIGACLLNWFYYLNPPSDIPEEKDFSTFRYLGNIGTVSLPITAAIAYEYRLTNPTHHTPTTITPTGKNPTPPADIQSHPTNPTPQTPRGNPPSQPNGTTSRPNSRQWHINAMRPPYHPLHPGVAIARTRRKGRSTISSFEI